MSTLWYTAAGLLLGSVFSAVVGLLIPPKVPKLVLWLVAVLTFGGALAAGMAAQRPNSDNEATGAAQCPSGTTDHTPSTSPIANVRVTPINAVEICVTWANPGDPTVAGFIITEYPQDSTDNAGPSGSPYPNPNLSSQLVNVEQFEASLRPEPGQHWKMCITPFGHGLDTDGNYPMITSRQGCSATFTWP